MKFETYSCGGSNTVKCMLNRVMQLLKMWSTYQYGCFYVVLLSLNLDPQVLLLHLLSEHEYDSSILLGM